MGNIVHQQRTSVAFASLLLLMIGCAEVDGRDPYALWTRFDQSEGVYGFYYLAPPWQLYTPLKEDDAETQIVTVDAASESPSSAVEKGALEARFKAVVTLRHNASAEDEAHADAERFAAAVGREVLVEDFKNGRGQTGKYLSVQLPDRYIRAVYFNVSSQRVAVMQLAGRESVSGGDFTLFLEGLEPEIVE